MNNTTNSSSQDNQGLSQQSLVYVVGPLAAILVIGIVAMMVWYRSRRNRANVDEYGWPRERLVGPDGNLMYYPGGRGFLRHGRWNVWGGMRSSEGLNELGEAPPPYDVKRVVVYGPMTREEAMREAAETQSSTVERTESSTSQPDNPDALPPSERPHVQLRDMENGAMPPGYAERYAPPARPPAAVTTQSHSQAIQDG